jgi:hypothetical protein
MKRMSTTVETGTARAGIPVDVSDKALEDPRRRVAAQTGPEKLEQRTRGRARRLCLSAVAEPLRSDANGEGKDLPRPTP